MRVLDVLLAMLVAGAGAQPDFSDFSPVDAVKGIPGSIKNALGTFRRGTSSMWKNAGQARVVRKRVKAGGEPASYQEVLLLRKSSEDTSKLIRAGFIYFVAPELIPATLYFFPSALPSTFEDNEGQLKRYRTLSRLRTKAALNLLCDLDEKAAKKGHKGVSGQAQSEAARRLLRAGSGSVGALRPLESYALPNEWEPRVVAKKPIRGIPGYALKAGCTMIGMSFPLPPWVRSAALHTHLRHLVAADEALARCDLRTLSRSELLEACFDRGMGRLSQDEGELRGQLRRWLELTSESRFSSGFGAPNPERLRLAAMAVCAVASCRDDKTALPQMLYAP